MLTSEVSYIRARNLSGQSDLKLMGEKKIETGQKQ